MSQTIYMALGSGVIGMIIMMLGYFMKNYFTSRDKHSDVADSERRKFIDVAVNIEKKLIQMEGDRNTEHAKLYGKFKQLEATLTGSVKQLETSLNAYTRENNKLAGKLEHNTEALDKSNKLLDHLCRQCKRLFGIVLPMQRDVDELKTGTGPS